MELDFLTANTSQRSDVHQEVPSRERSTTTTPVITPNEESFDPFGAVSSNVIIC